MNYLKQIYTSLLVLVVGIMSVGCDDDTKTLGSDIMPSTDLVVKESVSYDVLTESYSAGDSVLARSAMSYLGRFTDPETGTAIKSDFLMQFNCPTGELFPDTVLGDSIVSVDLHLFVSNYVGDSLATFKVSVYPLEKVMDPTKDYYTNIDPTQYCNINADPIAVKWYTLSDRSISDEERWSSGYYNNITISLPREVGQAIYERYRKNPGTFSNSESWINSGLVGSKGFYFRLESGDGAMAYIDVALMRLRFRYHDDTYVKDTVAVTDFAATEEVIQATRFENSNLDKLMGDKNATYLKSPAGIFTMATLPADQLNYNDTINAASIAFTRYNDRVDSRFKLDIPQTLLMVRLDDYLNGYFEKYKICDNVTSYLASYNKGRNTYEFQNISRLLRVMMQEKHNGTANPNYNKVLLIPVTPTYDSSSTLVKICHDFGMTSTRLVGGTDHLPMQVIYSKFKNKR